MTTPNRNHRALWRNVRIASDPRFISQVEYLQTASAIMLGGRPPSISQVVRRAVGLLVDHYAAITDVARIDGLSEAHPQDVAAERDAMETYRRIINADKPRRLVDNRGQLCSWRAALQLPLNLAIPTKAE
jgi:hypothetical protein